MEESLFQSGARTSNSCNHFSVEQNNYIKVSRECKLMWFLFMLFFLIRVNKCTMLFSYSKVITIMLNTARPSDNTAWLVGF